MFVLLFYRLRDKYKTCGRAREAGETVDSLSITLCNVSSLAKREP